jgi:hypothetical protein
MTKLRGRIGEFSEPRQSSFEAEQEFKTLTGAEPEGFELQIKALENLCRAGVNTQPAVMVSFSAPENLSELRKKLGQISRGFEHFETEELVLYGDVEDRLRKADIPYHVAYQPERLLLNRYRVFPANR